MHIYWYFYSEFAKFVLDITTLSTASTVPSRCSRWQQLVENWRDHGFCF